MEDKSNDAEKIYKQLIEKRKIEESDFDRIIKYLYKIINCFISNYSNNTLLNCKLLIQIIKRFSGDLSKNQDLMKLLFEKYKTDLLEYIKKIEEEKKNNKEINNQDKKEEKKEEKKQEQKEEIKEGKEDENKKKSPINEEFKTKLELLQQITQVYQNDRY